MKSYYDLIANDIINFNKLFLNEYKKLGLDEIDCVILLKLHEKNIKGNNSLDVDYLAKTMTLTNDQISEKIVSLVNKDLITLELLDMKGPEILSLEPLYRKLGYILEHKEVKKNKENTSNEAKEIVNLIEKELNRIPSPIDLQIINKWFYEYKYSIDDIRLEILNAKKYKNRGINYIDRCLYKKHNQEKKVDDSDIMELFSKIYVKR